MFCESSEWVTQQNSGLCALIVYSYLYLLWSMLLSQGPERKGNLEIREPIQDLKDSESGSNKTLTTRDTATTIGEFKFQDVKR